MPHRGDLDRYALEINSLRVERRTRHTLLSEAAERSIRWTFPEFDLRAISSVGLVSHHETRGLLSGSALTPHMSARGLVRRLKSQNVKLSDKNRTVPVEGLEQVTGEVDHKLVVLLGDPEGRLEEERGGYIDSLNSLAGLEIPYGDYTPDLTVGHVSGSSIEPDFDKLTRALKKSLPRRISLQPTHIHISFPRQEAYNRIR
jgi:hypothetical protein